MATIRPFQALRPPTDQAGAVAAVPYDVVNTEEARQLAANNPLSFLHVSRPEIDMPDTVDPYSDAVYEKAAENFETLKLKAPLTLESSPSLYIYLLQMGEHSQSGIAACCSIDEYDENIILKHEKTRKDKEDDRTRHMLTLGAQTGPVFMTYRGRPEINWLVSSEQTATPLYDFTAIDGVKHTIWRVSEDAKVKLIEAFRGIRRIYIADGHHRAASASRARAELRGMKPGRSHDDESNFFVSVLFPSDQVQILAYNRAVKDLNGLSVDEFFSVLSHHFELAEAPSASPQRKGQICAYVGAKWYSLTLPHGTTSPMDPISSLDVTVLQERVLSPVLGITDVRTDKRIDFVGGVRGATTLERMVDEGRAAIAFSMYPVQVEELIAIADAGEIMPPKSTWFEPKLRDGLLSHMI
jgi:uncharacterized protein (DUF1015 family)